MIQTGKELWAMAKGAKAATAASAAGAGAGAAGAGAAGAAGGASAGMAALGPIGIAAAVGLAILSKKGEKEGSPNLRYRPGMVDDDFMV